MINNSRIGDKNITYKPIGIIHSGNKIQESPPIQPIYAKECRGKVEGFPEFADGLKDIDDKIILTKKRLNAEGDGTLKNE
jgi:tRNA (Thr-GGU) A37 N-methylase